MVALHPYVIDSLVRPRRRRHYTLIGLSVSLIFYAYTTLVSFARTPLARERRRELTFFDNGDFLPSNQAEDERRRAQFHSLARPSALVNIVGNVDPCNDVLLYLPHTLAHEGHAKQLNGYLLAALIATYADKAMVVLEGTPTGMDKFKGDSQFGCTKEKIWRNPDFPRGLSRLIEHPTWLSGSCPVPCSDTYTFDDWDTIRTTRKNDPYYPKLYRPQEAACFIGNHRQTKVLVVGGNEASDYFREHFRERILEQPSLLHDWAIRLGAAPEEAEVFSRLENEQDVWDYASALIARAGLLKFQPWIARDIEKYVEESGLPLDESYDAVHVRRGDSLDTEETKRHVDEFWAAAADNADGREYIPFSHYLNQFRSEGCNKAEDAHSKPRLVYVATDDPDEVQREIDKLPQDQDGYTIYPDGCHKLRFIFSHLSWDNPFKRKPSRFHLHAGVTWGGCKDRYERNIAAVGDMMIAAKSDEFVGEFNSNWGRLMRVFRMQWNKTTTLMDGTTHLTGSNMKVAWGPANPFPVGL